MLNKYEVNYIYYLGCVLTIFLLSGFYGFMPGKSFLLIDYYNSINFPEFWNQNSAFYTVLPFNTLICIAFKKISEHSTIAPIIIGVIVAVCAVLAISLSKFENPTAFKATVAILNIPFLLGIYTGNIAVLFTFACFILLPRVLLSEDRFCLRNRFPFVIICLSLFKINLIVLVFYIFYLRGRSLIDFLRVTLKLILVYFSIQLLSFYLVLFFDDTYSIHKILDGFISYTGDYIRGSAGFDYRCWVGALYNAFKSFGIDTIYALFIIVVSYILMALSFFTNEKRMSLIQSLFAFSLLVFYLNVSMTLYWYTFFVPFLLFFLRKGSDYIFEIIVLTILLLPVPIVSKYYTAYSTIIYFVTISSYFAYLQLSIRCKTKFKVDESNCCV